MTLGIDLLQSGLCLCFGSMREQQNVIALPRVWTEESKMALLLQLTASGALVVSGEGGGCELICFNLDIGGTQPIYIDVSSLTDCVSSDRQNVFFMCTGISMQSCLFAPICVSVTSFFPMVPKR